MTPPGQRPDVDLEDTMETWPHPIRLFTERTLAAAGRAVAMAATHGGRRASVAWCLDAFYLAIARELERRGVSRKVAADMFGVSRRTFNRQLAAAEAAETDAETLAVRIHRFVAGAPASREAVADRFGWVAPRVMASLLRDLEATGWIAVDGDGVCHATKSALPWTDAELDRYLAVLVAYQADFSPAEVAADLGVPAARLDALWREAAPQWVLVESDTQRWATMTRVVERALGAAWQLLGGQGERVQGGAWTIGIRPGDRALLDALRAHVRDARDAAHDFTEARARPAAAGVEPLGEWSAVVVETLDFDPVDPRLDDGRDG